MSETKSGLSKRQTDLLAVLKQGKSQYDRAKSLIHRMEPIELVILDFKYSVEAKDLAYLTACADEYLMFETAYLWSVMGKPPYEGAIEFGLTEDDILQYQQQWRLVGVEPLEYEEKQQCK